MVNATAIEETIASFSDKNTSDDHVDFTESSQEKPQHVDIDVTYDILEKPELKFDSPVEFAAEEYATFNFTLKNNEEVNITVVGISGHVISNPEGYQVANISERAVGPYEVPVNGTLNFQTAVQLILPEGSFYVAPLVAVVQDQKPMRLGIRPLSIFVSPPPMSFFNPAFISVQVILALLIAVLVVPLMNYFKTDSKKAKAVKPTSVDESWLPETYKK